MHGISVNLLIVQEAFALFRFGQCILLFFSIVDAGGFKFAMMCFSALSSTTSRILACCMLKSLAC